MYGYTIVNDIYTENELEAIIHAIQGKERWNTGVRKDGELFAIRKFLEELPLLKELLFTARFKSQFHNLVGEGYFVIKSIYFDKHEQSNWFVPYHQDLMITVDQKKDLKGYGPWTLKQDQVSVQPPQPILKSIFTVRIHLDETNNLNGALKVVPGSHANGIVRKATNDRFNDSETICNVPKAGLMFMRPLLLHSSSRTKNNKGRRVIHIEFSNAELAPGLSWAEKNNLDFSRI